MFSNGNVDKREISTVAWYSAYFLKQRLFRANFCLFKAGGKMFRKFLAWLNKRPKTRFDSRHASFRKIHFKKMAGIFNRRSLWFSTIIKSRPFYRVEAEISVTIIRCPVTIIRGTAIISGFSLCFEFYPPNSSAIFDVENKLQLATKLRHMTA